MRDIAFAILAGALLASMTGNSEARCSRFNGSTMGDVGLWRTDYPTSSTGSPSPWTTYDFETEPEKYMDAVLATVRPYFHSSGNRLVGSAEPWWIAEWMDYGSNGREPLMGLTKERAPNSSDLSTTSEKGSQIWAVNFYNQAGAVTLGEVFADPCSPKLSPSGVSFLEGALAIKFLFTDANLGRFAHQVTYLEDGPTYEALIDPERNETTGINRMRRDVQLLQLDFAVKDRRAAKTGWVFGTFAWIAPKVGDGLFDNLVPVALAWANDAGVVTAEAIKESWINNALRGKLFGWEPRRYLGFLGRANGPADNLGSSCLSCHAAARVPESESGIAGSLSGDPNKIREYVEKWFKNIAAGELFEPMSNKLASNMPAVALDYSLILVSAIKRMCMACKFGAFPGSTPTICISAKLYDMAVCPSASTGEQGIWTEDPPRQ